MGVQKYRYPFIAIKTDDAANRSFGLIMQNAAAYFPGIVSETEDRSGRKLMGIAYSKTGVFAIKAIQEQE